MSTFISMKSVIDRYQKAKDGDNQLPSPDKEVKVQFIDRIILTSFFLQLLSIPTALAWTFLQTLI